MPDPADVRPPDTREPNARQRAAEGAKSYAFYSGLAFQMIGILLVSHFGGDLVAGWLGIDSALFKAGTMLVGVALSLYVPLRGLMK